MSSSPDDRSPNEYNSSHREETVDTTTSSGFTAVNGRGSPQTIKANGSIEDVIVVRTGHIPAEKQQTNGTTHGATNGTANVWSHANMNGERATRPDSADIQEHGSSVAGSPGKRKRSPSDADSAHRTDSSVASKRRSDYVNATGMSRHSSVSNGWQDSPEQSVQRLPNSGPHQNYQTPENTWHARPREEAALSDAQIAEALQRESHSVDGPRLSIETGTPADNRIPISQPSSTTEITAAGVKVDPKKRKRVFSNRTKTGCQTCRKRKKKCDEAKPECNNCQRGGFYCEGYYSKSTWTKPNVHKVPPVPLQSKEGYGDTGNLYPRPPRPEYVEATHGSDGAPTRPIVVDDEREGSRAGWPHAAQYVQNRPSSDGLVHGAPAADHTRKQNDSATQLTPINQAYYPHAQPVHSMSNSQSAMTAQLALQHQSSVGPSIASTLPRGAPPQQQQRQRPEKEKMLNGEYYHIFDPKLVDEREKCANALKRFNNEYSNVSAAERQRLFRQILEPDFASRNRSDILNPIGSLGKNVYVEAPFKCDYGYNIHIGEDVCIAANCLIQDPCMIKIGARCIIGPNVSIYGNNCSTDPHRRQFYGRTLIIEDDVFIGAGAHIVVSKSSMRIGKGSTVGAASTVVGNVPQYTVVVGNPARVLRGSYPSQD